MQEGLHFKMLKAWGQPDPHPIYPQQLEKL
jgi:hypothetical protein